VSRWRILFQLNPSQGLQAWREWAVQLPQIGAGFSLCALVFFLGLQALESTLPGGQPIWELSVTTQVRCIQGNPELPSTLVINATLPSSAPNQKRTSRKARFSVPQGVTWGKEGSLFVESANGLPRRLGQVELNKIRCLQPLEAEAAGVAPQARFEITLPLWLDPSSRVSLVRKPSFPCVRQGREGPSGSGLFTSAFAQERGPEVTLFENEEFWSRQNRDLLQISSYGDAPESTLLFHGTNLSLYQTWAACRLGELEKGSVLNRTQ